MALDPLTVIHLKKKSILVCSAAAACKCVRSWPLCRSDAPQTYDRYSSQTRLKSFLQPLASFRHAKIKNNMKNHIKVSAHTAFFPNSYPHAHHGVPPRNLLNPKRPSSDLGQPRSTSHSINLAFAELWFSIPLMTQSRSNVTIAESTERFRSTINGKGPSSFIRAAAWESPGNHFGTPVD